MQKNRLQMLLLCWLLLTVDVYAQKTLSTDKRERLRQNFDLLYHDPASGNVFYEQRLYRNPFIGLVEAQQIIADSTINSFIPLFEGVPLGKYVLGNELAFSTVSQDERKAYYNQHAFNPLQYKFDFVLQPQFNVRFGNYERPVESNTALLVLTQFYLARGLVINGGVLFPFVNKLDNRPNIIRPAPLYLNHFLAIQGNHYVSSSAGFFYQDQYGLNIQYRHMPLDRPFSFGAEVGFTGMYFYTEKGVYYGQVNNCLLQVDASYRFLHPNLTLKLSGGQYLRNEIGGRLDLIRQFPGVEVGLYTMSTSNGATLGFNFALSLPPGKIIQGKKLRLRMDEDFFWEYSYSGGSTIGQRYRVGYQLDRKLRQYHQQYLQQQNKLYQMVSADRH